MFGIQTQSEDFEEDELDFVSSPMFPVMEDASEFFSIDVPNSTVGGLEESKTLSVDDNVPRFNLIFFPECGLKIVQEYNVLTQESRRHEIDSPWAFPAGFAFCQTPTTNRLFMTGGIGDDE